MTKWLIVAAIGFSLMTNPASACKGAKVLFSDDFRVADPAWGIDAAPSVGSIGFGKFTIAPTNSVADSGSITTWTFLYSGSLFGDVDICATIIFPNTDAAKDQVAGIAFWGSDISNVYKFNISPAGTASIVRRQNGKAIFPVAWRKADAVKVTPGATNTLRVTLNGTSASTYINDKLFITIKGQPPEGGAQIGFSAGNAEHASFPFVFTDLKVTDLPK